MQWKVYRSNINTKLKAQPKERTFPCLLLLLCFNFQTEISLNERQFFKSASRIARKLFSPLARRLVQTSHIKNISAGVMQAARRITTAMVIQSSISHLEAEVNDSVRGWTRNFVGKQRLRFSQSYPGYCNATAACCRSGLRNRWTRVYVSSLIVERVHAFCSV